MKTLLLIFSFAASALAQSTLVADSQVSPMNNGAPNGRPFFYNTSVRYGWTDQLWVGDTYHFEIHSGGGYEPIVATRYQNGTQISTVYATTDANGVWIYDGVVQPYETGFWTETWNVSGEDLPMLIYNIYPATGPVQGSYAFWQDFTTGETDTVHVGDSYSFTWYGPPYATIAKNGVFNGQTLVNPSSWQLNGDGWATYQGTVLASEVGSWVEAWTVNGIPTTQLKFVVMAQ